MAKYTIDDRLYQQALAELRPKFGKGAEQVFYTSWKYATEANDTRALKKRTREDIEKMYPDRPGVPAEVAAHMKTFKEKQIVKDLQNAEEIFKLQAEIHRGHLITFFTMDKGISQTLAEKIVDYHILKVSVEA